MLPFAQIAVTFATTVLLAALVWATFSVYGLGEFESAWGRGGSVQVLWLLSIAMSLAALVGSAIGASMAGRNRAVAKRLVLVAALVYLPLSYGALWLLGAIGSPTPVVLVWLVLGPGLISFALVRGAGTPGRRDAERSDEAGRER
jgi:hypothetical protein